MKQPKVHTWNDGSGRAFPLRNCEGYMDLTPHDAIENIEAEKRDEERKNKLIKHIFYICDLAGFRVKNRLVLENKITGKVYK